VGWSLREGGDHDGPSIDNVRPRLRSPKYAHVSEEYSCADAAWVRGDLVGFREAIES